MIPASDPAFQAHIATANRMVWPVLGARGWRHSHTHRPKGPGDWHLEHHPHMHDHIRGGGADHDHHPIDAIPRVTAVEHSTR